MVDFVFKTEENNTVSDSKELNIKQIRFCHFNGIENVYIDLIKDTFDIGPKRDKVMAMNESCELHYGIDEELGLVSFGVWMFDENKRPSYNACWSSRPSIVGPMLGGLKLVDVAINNCSAHITVDKLMDIFHKYGLDDQFEIVTRSYCDEVSYEVMQK